MLDVRSHIPKQLRIIILTLSLLLIGAIGVYGLFRYSGAFIAVGINKFAPKLTQVETRVSHVLLNPWSGTAQIKDFFVANPAGYQLNSAIEIGLIRLSVKPSSLLSPQIRIDEMVIESAMLTWEGTLNQSNLLVIKKNLSKRAPNQSGEARTVHISKLVIVRPKVRVALFGSDAKVIELPSITLKNIGGKSGATTDKLALELINVIISEIDLKPTKTIQQLKDLLPKF